MNRKEAERIIHDEKLISYNFFEDRNDTSDEMVIKKVSDKWFVYATNERASKIISGKLYMIMKKLLWIILSED